MDRDLLLNRKLGECFENMKSIDLVLHCGGIQNAANGPEFIWKGSSLHLVALSPIRKARRKPNITFGILEK